MIGEGKLCGGNASTTWVIRHDNDVMQVA